MHSAPLYDRKIVNRIVYATAVLCLIAHAAPQDSVPVPERMVQPEWGPELEKDFLASSVKVELIVDAHGVPFAVSSQGGIPDNVVLSLEKWRFHPAKKDGKDAAQFGRSGCNSSQTAQPRIGPRDPAPMAAAEQRAHGRP